MHVVGQVDGVEEFLGLLAALVTGGAMRTVEFSHHDELVDGVEAGDEVRLLKDDADLLPAQFGGTGVVESGDVDAVNEDGAGVGPGQGGSDGQEARFSRPGRSGDDGDVPVVDVHADVLQGGDATVAVWTGEGDVVEGDHAKLLKTVGTDRSAGRAEGLLGFCPRQGADGHSSSGKAQ